jgi:antitoxin HicB
MAFGYRYKLERQENGWWLVRFPGIPEALTEGETEDEARRNALDCVMAALEGYMKAGKPLPRRGAGHSGPHRAVLPSLVTAKLAVYETMRARGWSKLRLAKELGMPENSMRRPRSAPQFANVDHRRSAREDECRAVRRFAESAPARKGGLNGSVRGWRAEFLALECARRADQRSIICVCVCLDA